MIEQAKDRDGRASLCNIISTKARLAESSVDLHQASSA